MLSQPGGNPVGMTGPSMLPLPSPDASSRPPTSAGGKTQFPLFTPINPGTPSPAGPLPRLAVSSALPSNYNCSAPLPSQISPSYCFSQQAQGAGPYQQPAVQHNFWNAKSSIQGTAFNQSGGPAMVGYEPAVSHSSSQSWQTAACPSSLSLPNQSQHGLQFKLPSQPPMQAGARGCPAGAGETQPGHLEKQNSSRSPSSTASSDDGLGDAAGNTGNAQVAAVPGPLATANSMPHWPGAQGGDSTFGAPSSDAAFVQQLDCLQPRRDQPQQNARLKSKLPLLSTFQVNALFGNQGFVLGHPQPMQTQPHHKKARMHMHGGMNGANMPQSAANDQAMLSSQMPCLVTEEQQAYDSNHKTSRPPSAFQQMQHQMLADFDPAECYTAAEGDDAGDMDKIMNWFDNVQESTLMRASSAPANLIRQAQLALSALDGQESVTRGPSSPPTGGPLCTLERAQTAQPTGLPLQLDAYLGADCGSADPGRRGDQHQRSHRDLIMASPHAPQLAVSACSTDSPAGVNMGDMGGLLHVDDTCWMNLSPGDVDFGVGNLLDGEIGSPGGVCAPHDVNLAELMNLLQ